MREGEEWKTQENFQEVQEILSSFLSPQVFWLEGKNETLSLSWHAFGILVGIFYNPDLKSIPQILYNY